MAKVATSSIPFPSGKGRARVEWWLSAPDQDFSALTQDYLFEKAVVGQRRTSAYKMYVFIIGRFAIKGPYRDFKRIETIKDRYAKLRAWDAKMVIQARGLAWIPDRAGADQKLHPYLVFPNIYVSTPTHIKTYPDLGTGRTLRVMEPRERYVKLNDASALKNADFRRRFYAMEDQFADLVAHYILLDALGVGDVNLSNTLVDLQTLRVFIIDIDENRTSKESIAFASNPRPDWYFNKSAGKEMQWNEHVAAVAEKIADKTQAHAHLGPSIFVPGGDIKNLIPILRGSGGKNRSEGPPHPPQPELEIFDLNDILADPEPSQPSSSSSSSNIGGMHTRKSFRSDIGYTYSSNRPELWQHLLDSGPDYIRTKLEHGANPFTTGTLKSVLQKAIRRGILPDALEAAVELYRMGEIGFMAGPKALFQRLSVIAVEDIGPASLALVTDVVHQAGMLGWDAGASSFHSIVPRIWAMCQAPKTRVISHLWTVYVKPSGMAAAQARGIKIDLKPEPRDRPYLQRAKDTFFHQNDNLELVRLGMMFYSRLAQRDYTCISYLAKFMASAVVKEHTITRLPSDQKLITRVIQPEIRLYAMFHQLMPEYKTLVDTMMQAYFKAGKAIKGDKYPDRRIYPMLLILVYIFQLPPVPPMTYPRQLQQVSDQAAAILMTGKYNLEPKAYALDMHTQFLKGKAGVAEFKETGSEVLNEDMDYRLEIPYEIYKLG